jgi:hypothetical protein
MATLTADRHLAQRSLLDPHEEERVLRRPQPQVATPSASPTPSRPTLDDLVAGTWDALLHIHTAACLVCGGDLTPRWSSGPHPVGAKCPSCHAELR